jgi:hypothetical protein
MVGPRPRSHRQRSKLWRVGPGAITEADEAGVDLKKVQDFATHTDAASTERYRRRRVRANAEVAKARVEHRRAANDGENE